VDEASAGEAAAEAAAEAVVPEADAVVPVRRLVAADAAAVEPEPAPEWPAEEAAPMEEEAAAPVEQAAAAEEEEAVQVEEEATACVQSAALPMEEATSSVQPSEPAAQLSAPVLPAPPPAPSLAATAVAQPARASGKKLRYWQPCASCASLRNVPKSVHDEVSVSPLCFSEFPLKLHGKPSPWETDWLRVVCECVNIQVGDWGSAD
jgi:hypothetical protein